MTLVDADGVRHFPAEAGEVYDTSGCGDTALAALAAGVAAKLPLAVAVRLANIAAGVVVGKVGSAVAHEAELLAAVSPERSAIRKVVSLEEAAELAERWRHRGWRVGFTNGCFDLLHPGHLHLLEAGRAGCDRLIVGLNSDRSARRLKGPMRPAQPQDARAAILASLASVDLVCVFDEDTPERLIRAVRPDVLITGGDGRGGGGLRRGSGARMGRQGHRRGCAAGPFDAGDAGADPRLTSVAAGGSAGSPHGRRHRWPGEVCRHHVARPGTAVG